MAFMDTSGFFQNSHYRFKVLPPLPPGSPDVMEGANTKLPRMEKILPSLPLAKSAWLSDAADLFVLLCSFLLTTTTIVYLALVSHAQATADPSLAFVPDRSLSFLSRVISSLSLAVASAVVMVAGKRYVLFKLARDGLRSQRVAVYSNPTIGNMASYMVFQGAELPLLGLSAVWALALVTGLTANDSWQTGTRLSSILAALPSGPFDQKNLNSSWVDPAIGQLTFVMSMWCLELVNTARLISIMSDSIGRSTFYPPLTFTYWFTGFITDYSFSAHTTMNGFHVSVEPISSVPSTARQLSNCVPNNFADLQLPEPWTSLWYAGSDNQTLSIIAVGNSTTRVNATAIIMGGTLSSFGNYTKFTLDGTSQPNMSADNQWAEDIMNVICNATIPSSTGMCDIGSAAGSLTFLDFVSSFYLLEPEEAGQSYWSSVLNMAIGAYSTAMLFSDAQLPASGSQPNVTTVWIPITVYGVGIGSAYGFYVLCLNIAVSFVVLILVLWLRIASRLRADFLNSTRLLLDPLKKRALFNASLQTTVDALADPYMFVGPDDEFFLIEKSLTERKERRKWFGAFNRRRLTRSYSSDSIAEEM